MRVVGAMAYIQLVDVKISAGTNNGSGPKFYWNYYNCCCFVDELQRQYKAHNDQACHH